MVKSEKRLKELAAVLGKNNDEETVRVILSLREEEPFEGAITLLAEKYEHTINTLLIKTIEAFFNDLRDPSLREEVISEARKHYNNNTIRMLLSSCWQSGLDYSDWAVELTDLFVSREYNIALECLTILEYSAGSIAPATRNNMINTIRESLITNSGEKSRLADELINILR